MPDPTPDITADLQAWSAGESGAAARLLPAIYDELSRIAARYLRSERPDHTLDSKALVHEAYLKLIAQDRVAWHSRAHFFAIAAQAMRRILIDHARARGVHKRSGGARVTFNDDVRGEQHSLDFLALDEALQGLSRLDEQQSAIVELRFFAGLTHEEIAAVLQVSVSTVERKWRLARAWLYRALGAEARPTAT